MEFIGLDPEADVAASSSGDLKSVFPTELEIQIISNVPFKYWRNIRQVCKRWQAITLLPDILYLPITMQQNLQYLGAEGFKFQIHRAVYEVAEFFGSSTDCNGFRVPERRVRQSISPYLDHQLTIPPMPHTLQQVEFNIAMPPRDDRPGRPGYVFKAFPVPCRNVRKLLLVPNLTDSNKMEISNLNGDQEPTGLTIGEFFYSLEERARVRLGDVFDTMQIRWRVKDPQREWWWKNWNIEPGLYKLVLVSSEKATEQEQVLFEVNYRKNSSI
ncbi:hypothetical protein TWF730_011171 [Orbilia blumenaviensis]|uniref:F-box domain-containing protein n=1 Tax=Orbilia blumenaviensis TaxID=1796055 RepID=A0AAV9UQS9_9PEZI